MRKFLPSNRKGNADNSGKGRFEGVKRALKAPLLRTSIDLALSEDYNLVTKAAVSEIEKLAQKV
jgi:transposase